jgi:release factor glutamine methyltransferase
VREPRFEVDAAAVRLAASGVESARHDAEALIAWALGTGRRAALSAAHLDNREIERFRAAVNRRARREPLQHITGTAAFRYLELEVGPGVFIPRPETEVLAGVAVDELRRLTGVVLDDVLAVDLCTGSGAIALAMATEVPGTHVTAVEVSQPAYEYAVRNASRLAPTVDVRLGDITDAAADLGGRAHVVTANPPYIPLDAFESVAAEARDHDPPVALWSGSDGLDAMRVVADVAAALLVDGGLLLCEHADVQGESAPAMFAAHGAWREVRDHGDLAARPRFVTARRANRARPAPGTMSS